MSYNALDYFKQILAGIDAIRAAIPGALKPSAPHEAGRRFTIHCVDPSAELVSVTVKHPETGMMTQLTDFGEFTDEACPYPVYQAIATSCWKENDDKFGRILDPVDAEGEQCFFVDSEGDICCIVFSGDSEGDFAKFNHGNLFWDEESAGRYAHYLQVVASTRDAMAKSWGDEKVYWWKSDQQKWIVQMEVFDDNRVVPTPALWHTIMQPYCFKTEHDCQKFIDDMSISDLQLLLTGV